MLLIEDCAGWLVREAESKLRAPPGEERFFPNLERLGVTHHMAQIRETFTDTEFSAFEIIPLLLPRRWFEHLQNGMKALHAGEVRPIFEPKKSQRHGARWTWDEARIRAVEHVEYLRGQGFTDKRARADVGAAMKVAPATLRDWRVDFDDDDWVGPVCLRREEALAAGEIKRQLDMGGTVDLAVTGPGLAFYKEVQKEPLREFGNRYRTLYGRRHHTPYRAP